MIVLTVVLGCLAGVVGFLPFLLVGGKMRKMFIEQGTKVLKFILLLPIVSAILMLAMIMLYLWLDPTRAMIFAVVSIAVFLLSTIVWGVLQMKSISEKHKKR